MKCNKCGTFIKMNNNICPNCSNAVQSSTINNSQKTINKSNIIKTNNEEIEFLDLKEKPTASKQIISKPKKHNEKTLFIVYMSILILIVIIITLSTLLFKMDKPRQVFKTSLSVLKSEINNAFLINRSAYQLSYDIKTNLNESDEKNGELYKKINEITINLDLFNNIEKNYTFFDLVTTYQYKNHVNIIGMLDRNLFYLNSPSDFKEYYVIDTYDNIFAGINRITNEELLTVINTLITSFEGVLKSDYFKETQTKIKLEDKELDLITDTFIINEQNIKEITQKVIKKLKKDSEFINACAKYQNIDGIDFIGKLNRLSESVQIGEYKVPEIEISIYLDTNEKIKGFGLKTNNKVYNLFIEENEINIYENNNEKIVNIKKDEEGYKINFSGGTIIINYKKNENPIFSKPVIDTSVLYETLTEEELKELNKKIYDKPIMNMFLKDFENFINSIKTNINKLLEPSKNKFKNDIEKIIEKAKHEKPNIQSLSGNNVFTNEITIPGNKLNINKIKSIYYVKIDQTSNIKNISYLNNLYCFNSSEIENLEYVNKEDINEKYFKFRTKKDSYEECKSILKPFN